MQQSDVYMQQSDVSDQPAGPATHVVGVGASAGGLSALKEFFSGMSPDVRAAFVVLQHLSPDKRSLSPDLVAEHTSLPVRVAEDGSTPTPGEVVFLPPDSSLRIEQGVLILGDLPETDSRAAVIDIFFKSLARDQGRRAIGVLLSGTGSDGALGLKAVQEHGGTTLVQDPETAEFGGMPWSAVRADAADYVQPARQLAITLTDLVDRSQASSTEGIPEQELEEIAGILHSRTGHDLDKYKRGTVTRRLERRLKLHGSDDPEAYVDALRSDPDELDALFDDLLIGVTEFFRDREEWEALAESVIPDLFHERGPDENVRAWVSGCATGEEVYSLAILLAEEMGSSPEDGPDFTLFATDIDEKALAFAREALYPAGIAESVSTERLERFFARQDDHYRVARRLRERCVFAPHDLLQDPPFSDLDLVVCRNLLIYLRPEAQKTALGIFEYALREGGYLFLGSSESLTARQEQFDAAAGPTRIFRRNERDGDGLTGLFGTGRQVRRTATPATTSRREHRPSGERSGEPRAGQTMPRDHDPAVVLIDAERRVRGFFGPTRKYLEPGAAGEETDVVDMALPPVRDAVRTAIQRALAGEGEAVEESREVETGSATEFVEVAVRPANQFDGGEDLFLLVFRGRPVARGDAQPIRTGHTETDGDESDLEAKLRATRQRLQSTIEELQSSNEELQSANEELQSMNEELQTSREETQTVNQELRNKVESLDRAHSDLKNLFRSTQIATIFLDKELCIQRFNPPATDLFRLRRSDAGRSIRDITQRFEDGDLEGEVEKVLETLVPRQREVRLPEDDSWYSLRISPYRTVDDEIEGAVLTFTDITRIKETEARLRRQREYAQSIVETVSQPLVVLGPELRVVSAGRAFYEKFGLRPEEVEDRPFLDLHPEEWGLSEERLERARAGEETIDGLETEVQVQRGDGTRILRVAARQILSGEGTDPAGDRVLVTLQDVTERRRWEEDRREEARQKDWFLTLLGHELRNPLASLRGGVDLLRRREFDRSVEKILDTMDRSADHLQRLVDDLLDLARIASGEIPFEKEQVDLTAVVRKAVDDHRSALQGDDRTLEVELPTGPVRAEVDPARIKQALVNLLSNADKFTSPGDRVTVTLERDADGETASLAVADTGRGMTAEELEHAFEAFHTSGGGPEPGEEGLGIGLTLVKEVVEGHGGSVEASSAGPGAGTKFTMRLPVEPEIEEDEEDEDVTEEHGVDGSPVPSRSLRILIVEDNASAAAMLRLLLEADDHRVATEIDGESALRAIRESRPDIVLCDLGLPGDMNGRDVARAVRSSEEIDDVPLVALSGFGQDSDRMESLDAGFDAYLVKPVRAQELEKTLVELAGTEEELES